MNQSLIDAVKEIAVVAAMNAAIYSLSLRLRPEDIEAGKAKYMSQVETQSDEVNKILFLFQNWRETATIGPLYGTFTSAWQAGAVEKGVNKFCNSNGAMEGWKIRLLGGAF